MAGEVTQILDAIRSGDATPEELISLVYDELRRLASHQLSHEQPGQTLQATALVHEAYLRLLGDRDPAWKNRRHFFSAAAEAMRRILVENARRKGAQKRGGRLSRRELNEHYLVGSIPPEELMAVDGCRSLLLSSSRGCLIYVGTVSVSGLIYYSTEASFNVSAGRGIQPKM
jgi:RNA polymerase sigma factor (TIGR02999 family)